MPRRFRGEPATAFAAILITYMRGHQPWPLDQSELADLIGVSHNTVNGWLTKGKLPRNPAQLVPRISAATGIPQAQLFASLGLGLDPPAPHTAPQVRVIEVDRFGELIADLRAQARLDPAQKWHAINAAWEVAHGLSRPRQWIESEHAPATEPALPAVSAPPTPALSTNTETNPAQASAEPVSKE